MGTNCASCGASGELERDVVIAEARACMACGHVRIFSREVVYSDNPHVDPELVERELAVDPEALAWVSALPRRSSSGDAFLAASSRAPTREALDALERRAADQRASSSSMLEALRAAGLPGAPPAGHMSKLFPFVVLNDVLATTKLDNLLMHAADGAEPVRTLARDVLAARTNVLGEAAAMIDALRPELISVAASLRASATPDEIASLDRAIHAKLGRTSPHSSDVTELERALAALHRPA